MGTFAWDTFVEAADTSLVSHTPTGSNAGTSWTADGAAAGTVLGGSNLVRDNNTLSGNRFLISPDIGVENIDGQVDISFTNAVSGDFLFAGITFRSNSSFSALEFLYDWAVSGGSWTLDTSSTVAAWPGGIVTMSVKCRDANVYAYANGTLIFTYVDTGFRNRTRAGLVLGNFTGLGTKRSNAANFRANPATASTFYLRA